VTQTNSALHNPSVTPVRVVPITTDAQWKEFLDVPSRVYQNDPNWVPPLRSSIAKQLAPTHPFRQYGELQGFLAYQTGANGGKEQAVGRVVAAVNQRLIERESQNVGLIGYFECINDSAIADALLSAACDWLRQKGMTLARGPIDLFTHNHCLFLADGFDSPPTMMMPYNPSYYLQFMEQAGWHKAIDAYAYEWHIDPAFVATFEKSYRIACKSGVTFRPVHLKGEDFTKDCRSLYRLFSKMFANNWSSTPRTEEDFVEEAKDLKTIVDPDIFPIAEYNGEMIGFFMALPDYNIALKHVNGKLDLVGILKLLWYRRKINQARVLVICSLPEFRRKMVSPALIYLGMQGSLGKYDWAELGFVYETNEPSRKLIEASGGTIHKTYRAYEKSLV